MDRELLDLLRELRTFVAERTSAKDFPNGYGREIVVRIDDAINDLSAELAERESDLAQAYREGR